MPASLFTPYKLNDTLTLNNRILMAPLTRCMADDDLVPTQTMADYYARRADAGLIISEATIIRPDGQGYVNTPGLYTQAQVDGWKVVTKAVHDKGGKIFAQLWHTGRVAHPFFFGEGNGEVLSASNIGIEGTIPRNRELMYQQPKAATVRILLSWWQIMQPQQTTRSRRALMALKFMVLMATSLINFYITPVITAQMNMVNHQKIWHVLPLK